MTALEDGKLTTTRSRVWGQYRRPNEPILVKLPADIDSKKRYLSKGFIFVRYGGDELPIAELDIPVEVVMRPAPVVEPVKEEIVSEPVAAEEPAVAGTDEPELYVSDKPYKSKRKKKRKNKSKEV